MAYYQSPRWSNEIADCSMPMTFDTYSNCSFGCLYCFSQFQRAIGGPKENYLAKEVKNVNPEKIKNMFRDPDKYAGQSPYTLFEGALVPSGKDEEGNLIYKYNGATF